MLGRERVREVTVQRVNQLFLFCLTRWPVTIRQGYYHLDVLGLIAKTEAGYQVVQDLMNQMLDAGVIAPDWVVDLSREPHIWRGYDSIAHALRSAADGYYNFLFQLDKSTYVQVWIEKSALVETIKDPCATRCVSLWPARGYASRSFLRRASKEILAAGKPTYIYALGDYDAAGWFAAEHIEDMLNAYARRAGIPRGHYLRARRAHRRADLDKDLPTRDSKEIDDRGRAIPSAPAFRAMQERSLTGRMTSLIGRSCELDALDPLELRNIVEECVARHLPDWRLAELQAQELAEKAKLTRFADRIERRWG